MSGLDELFNHRVLTAAKRRDRDGEFWTVIDRDTGQLIGSFGMMVQVATCEEALDEALRFGLKWGWSIDREAVREIP